MPAPNGCCRSQKACASPAAVESNAVDAAAATAETDSSAHVFSRRATLITGAVASGALLASCAEGDSNVTAPEGTVEVGSASAVGVGKAARLTHGSTTVIVPSRLRASTRRSAPSAPTRAARCRCRIPTASCAPATAPSSLYLTARSCTAPRSHPLPATRCRRRAAKFSSPTPPTIPKPAAQNLRTAKPRPSRLMGGALCCLMVPAATDACYCDALLREAQAGTQVRPLSGCGAASDPLHERTELYRQPVAHAGPR